MKLARITDASAKALNRTELPSFTSWKTMLIYPCTKCMYCCLNPSTCLAGSTHQIHSQQSSGQSISIKLKPQRVSPAQTDLSLITDSHSGSQIPPVLETRKFTSFPSWPHAFPRALRCRNMRRAPAQAPWVMEREE